MLLINSLRIDRKTYDTIDKMQTSWGSWSKAQINLYEGKWNGSWKKVYIYVNFAVLFFFFNISGYVILMFL